VPSDLSALYRRHRYPAEIITHAVWLYYRFNLSFRDVEELMAERGVQVSYETIRRWCAKFGLTFALQLRRGRARPGDKWHLDELAIRICGHRHWLWRAVDQHAAERFLRQIINGVGYEPRVVITDKLASYPPAIRRVLPNVDHRRHKGLNNRAENSHLPVRKRERVLQRFKSTEHVQTFLSVFGHIGNHFRPRRHLLSASEYRRTRAERFATWRQAVGLNG
jgi:putative transposase